MLTAPMTPWSLRLVLRCVPSAWYLWLESDIGAGGMSWAKGVELEQSRAELHLEKELISRGQAAANPVTARRPAFVILE
jgi:hypothetical protein